MSDYQLTITRPGQPPAVRTVAGNTPLDLATAVHRHARGLLGGQITIRIDELGGTVHRGSAHVADFTLTLTTEPDPQPTPEPNPDAIRGGWTLATLDKLARAVVSNNRTWWPAGDRDDQYAAAWHGIVEHLYTADDVPTRIALMEAGRRALANDARDTMRHHGARRDTSNNGAKYAMYWQWAGRAVPSPETGIVERIALWEILSTLTRGQRAAVEALAVAGGYGEAAALLGAAQKSFESQLMKGRQRFRALWHEGEAPSGHWGCDRRAGTVRGTVGQGSAVSRMRRRARDAARREAGS